MPFWSGGEQLIKRTHINRNIVSLPKQEVDIGFRRMSELNDACMLNLGWNAIFSSSLWARRFKSKYLGFLLLAPLFNKIQVLHLWSCQIIISLSKRKLEMGKVPTSLSPIFLLWSSLSQLPHSRWQGVFISAPAKRNPKLPHQYSLSFNSFPPA